MASSRFVRPVSALLSSCGAVRNATRHTPGYVQNHLLRMAPAGISFQGQRCVYYSSDIPREEIPISRFPVPDMNSLPQDLQERIGVIVEKTGFVPNVFRVLAHRPVELTAFSDYYDALMNKETGSLSKAERELIVVATSAANDCLYCVVSHSALHRLFSKKPYVADQVATNPDFANLTSRERAIISFALDICEMTPIEDSDLEDLEQHGLSREDIWDIGAIASLFALSNRMAHLTAMRPNEEFYLLGRVPREKK